MTWAHLFSDSWKRLHYFWWIRNNFLWIRKENESGIKSENFASGGFVSGILFWCKYTSLFRMLRASFPGSHTRSIKKTIVKVFVSQETLSRIRGNQFSVNGMILPANPERYESWIIRSKNWLFGETSRLERGFHVFSTLRLWYGMGILDMIILDQIIFPRQIFILWISWCWILICSHEHALHKWECRKATRSLRLRRVELPNVSSRAFANGKKRTNCR